MRMAVLIDCQWFYIPSVNPTLGRLQLICNCSFKILFCVEHISNGAIRLKKVYFSVWINLGILFSFVIFAIIQPVQSKSGLSLCDTNNVWK